MAIEETGIPIHWSYFLALEQDVIKLSRFIEFTKSNYDTYSIELARLLMAASAEVDVIAKLLCKKINSQSVARNVHEYQNEIMAEFPWIAETKIRAPRYGLTFTPWENWGIGENMPPAWWTSHNKVKHQRDTNFHEATLQNALNSIAALFLLLLIYYQNEILSRQHKSWPVVFRYSRFDGGDLPFDMNF